jgi:hypothetical protein
MFEIFWASVIGLGIIGSRIIWCHFDAKKWENEKIRKGIR